MTSRRLFGPAALAAVLALPPTMSAQSTASPAGSCNLSAFQSTPADPTWAPDKILIDRLLRWKPTSAGCQNPFNQVFVRLTSGWPSPFDLILRQMDQLALTSAQADSFAVLNRWFMRTREEMGRAIATYVYETPDSLGVDAVWIHVLPMYERWLSTIGPLGSAGRSVLTKEQAVLISPAVMAQMNVVCVRDEHLRGLHATTKVEQAVEIANRRRETGCL